MYDAEFICTYKMMDTIEEQEHLYKIQLLQAFCLEEWNEEIINNSLIELFDIMKLDDNLQKILFHLTTVEGLQDIICMANEYIDRQYANEVGANEVGANEVLLDADYNKKMVLFGLLFQYDFFDVFHKCVYDFTQHSCITDKTMNVFLSSL